MTCGNKVYDAMPVYMQLKGLFRYLHVVEGTLGSDLGAGLFTKRA